MTDHPRRITRALLSVSDKTGLVDFARALAGYGVELDLDRRHRQGADGCRAEGHRRRRSHRLSRNDGRPGQDAAPEGAWRPAGDPRQQGARRGDARSTASGRSICWWSISIRSRRRSPKGADFDDCIENIDIGGPAMIRAAAKNHADVDGGRRAGGLRAVLDELAQHGGTTTLALRQKLAAKAYARTAAYDAAISNWFADTLARCRAGLPRLRRPAHPRRCATARTRTRARRSTARRSSAPASPPRGRCRASSSPTTTSTTPTRPMNASPSSIPSAPRPASSSSTPIRAAWRKAAACSTPTQGAGLRSDLGLRRHRRAQPPLDAEAARAITEIFTEVIIAPDADEEAIDIVAAQEESAAAARRRPARSARAGLTVKSVAGGLLVQSRDNAVVDDMQLKVVTKRAPSEAELRRSALRLPRRQAREVEHHRLCQGPRHRRHRRRADEPRRFRAHRRAQGARTRRRS